MNIERRLFVVSLFLLVPLLMACTQKKSGTDEKLADGEKEPIRHIESDAAKSTSMANITSAEEPLVRTDQFMALNQDGKLVGKDNTRQQIRKVTENIRLALEEAGTELENLARLNVYVANNDVANKVRAYFAETFTNKVKPAFSFVVTNLPLQKAMVAMDAVAVAPGVEVGERKVSQSDSISGAKEQGSAAIMPPGNKVYISGQVAPGDLLEATSGTIQKLHGTLAYLGLSTNDVIQVKAYIPDMGKASEVRQRIAKYYPQNLVPPIVSVEWNKGDYLWYLSTDKEDATPIEISLIASGEASTVESIDRDTLNYLSYPGSPDYPGYSRIVTVPQADLVYTSGLYGTTSKDTKSEVQDIFHKMNNILQKAGSDFDHLVKGTYYVTGEESSDQLGSIRKDLFNPDRFPASDKMPVRGVGKKGATTTINMIGVVPK